jgi:molybdopterin adenylyltransferase
MIMAMKVVSVNISEKKGTVKKPVKEITLWAEGVKDDAHGGKWHRQVSLLGVESFEKFSKQAGRNLEWGEFAENITTEGLLLYECRPFDRINIGETELEVTQIGKSCHGDNCAIYREVGNCVMPKEGIFCRVLTGGKIKAGDPFVYHPKEIVVTVITLSDRASSGEYTDRSGPLIAERAKELFGMSGYPVKINHHIIPDDAEALTGLFKAAVGGSDVLFTTGGTGLGPRDITVDTLTPFLEKEIPGIMDHIRLKYGSANPNALISRSVAGMTGSTPVFALPGSVKAVSEYLNEIMPLLKHLLFMIHGIDSH